MAGTSLNILYEAQKRNDGEIKGLTVRVNKIDQSLGVLKEELREIKEQMSLIFEFMKEEEKPRTVSASHVFDEMPKSVASDVTLDQYEFNSLECVNTVIDDEDNCDTNFQEDIVINIDESLIEMKVIVEQTGPRKSDDAGSYPINSFSLMEEKIVIHTDTSFNKWNSHLSHSWTVGEFEVGLDYVSRLNHILYCLNDNSVVQFDPGGLLLKFAHYKNYIQSSDMSSLERSIHFDSISHSHYKNCHSLVSATVELIPAKSIVTSLGAACENWKKILGTYVESFYNMAYLSLAFIVHGFHTSECCSLSIFLLWKNSTQIVDTRVIWFLCATQKQGTCASRLNHYDSHEFEGAHQLMSCLEHLICSYSFCHIQALQLRWMILCFIRIWDPGGASSWMGWTSFMSL